MRFSYIQLNVFRMVFSYTHRLTRPHPPPKKKRHMDQRYIAGLSPILTPPGSWCSGMACLSGNTNSDFNNSWTLPTAPWLRAREDSVTPGAESRATQDSCMLEADPLTDIRKTCSPWMQTPQTLFYNYTLWAVPGDYFWRVCIYFPSLPARFYHTHHKNWWLKVKLQDLL